MKFERMIATTLGLSMASACGAGSEATGAASDAHDGTHDIEATGGSREDTDRSATEETDESASPDASAGSNSPTEGGDDATDSQGDPATTDDGGTDTDRPPIDGCNLPVASSAPLRRLSNFEYANTVAALLGADALPRATQLPTESGGYGNNTNYQYPSRLTVEQYHHAAKQIVANALSTPELRQAHFACLDDITPEDEEACVRSIIDDFGAAAFRRPLDATTVDELVSLQTDLRGNGTFEQSIASLLEAMLQGPDFLYRLEFGVPGAEPNLLRPDGYEMASRLSYLLWGTMPDAELRAAAEGGQLDTAAGVLAQATRLIADQQVRPVAAEFFNGFIGLEYLVQRPVPESLPEFSEPVSSLLFRETLGFLEHELFEGSGSWREALTAPYVFANEELATYYGIEGVTGPQFRVVEVEPEVTHRRGLLTQGSVLMGTSTGEYTNPFRRGHFVAVRLMCFDLPPPPNILPTVPEPEVSMLATTRERFTQTTLADPTCALCHMHTDPIGFALENYDAGALWREQENGVVIDSGASTPVLGQFSGPDDLIAKVAAHDNTYACFANNWAEFGYGRELDPVLDRCTLAQLEQAFEGSGYQLKALLAELTQTDAFLYLPTPEVTQ